ncbi:MAG: radical SAM/SPASM domain-containing protein [Myxococcota bacterium]
MPLPQFVEVEIGTYCNRRCAWCPNGWHDRGTREQWLAEETWLALLQDLGRHDFRGWFAFHNYNEPMADPNLMTRVAQAREQLPHAKLTIYTNGDFLTANNAKELAAAGVNELRVTRYPSNAEAFTPPDPDVSERFLARVGLKPVGASRSKTRKLERVARIGRMRISVRQPVVEHYTDRAGSVGLVQLRPRTKRTRPCLLPVQAAAIDVHGHLKLCCHIYDTSLPENAPYVLGHVGSTPFTELWNGVLMQEARSRLLRADFSGLPACATCTHRMTPAMENRTRTLQRVMAADES